MNKKKNLWFDPICRQFDTKQPPPKMVDYIQVGTHKKRLKWLPTEINGTVSWEVLQSAFPHSSGMCFKVNGECFVIRIQNGNFYPPAGGWQRYDYQPIFEDDEYNPGEFGFDKWVSVTNFFDVNPISILSQPSLATI